MSWKKYFKSSNLPSNISPLGGGRMPDPGYRNYQSNLPDVYIGHPNRIERYNQYEQMDMDSEINAALDILSEFMTQKNEANNTPFDVKFKDNPTDNEIKIIGTRHGEKLYETLCTREEMVKAEDMGDFYRIPADNRDLNYAQYFSQGEQDVSLIEDYHSHNTTQQDVEGMKQLLSKLPLIRKEIFGEEVIQMPG